MKGLFGSISGVRLIGHPAIPIISLDFENLDNAEAAFRLESEYGILTRCGLHCAPEAHMAPATIGLGPGFTAGRDVRAVIETKRGRTLGRVIWSGEAIPSTGIPGVVGGFGKERFIHAPVEGFIYIIRDIGSKVENDEIIAMIGGALVRASIPGIVRGMLREGFYVPKGMKMADIDPRENADWHTVSDKALAVTGGVLEALPQMGVRP